MFLFSYYRNQHSFDRRSSKVVGIDHEGVSTPAVYKEFIMHLCGKKKPNKFQVKLLYMQMHDMRCRLYVNAEGEPPVVWVRSRRGMYNEVGQSLRCQLT